MKEKASEVLLFSKLKAHSVYTLARKKGRSRFIRLSMYADVGTKMSNKTGKDIVLSNDTLFREVRLAGYCPGVLYPL